MSNVIECGHASYWEPAVTGGIVVVQPNGLASSHAIYYACAAHPRVLGKALETWPVRLAEPQREEAPSP
jgi:hypothetical protein